MTDLTSKKELLHKMRLELNTLMTQALADTADALSDKADAVLAACQRLMSLLPRYRPVPLLAGIGARLHCTCAVTVVRHTPACHNPACMFNLEQRCF